MTLSMATATGGYELVIQSCPSTLEVVSFTGKEALSKHYVFEVRVACTDDLTPTGEDSYLRARALLRMPEGNATRLARGIVASIVPEGAATGASAAQLYRIRIVPTMWLARHRIRSRIFQHLSVPDIAAEVLGAHEYASLGVVLAQDLHQPHPPRAYCMQYQESDYAFLRRILSEEGILFYFDHGTQDDVAAVERLVLLDTAEYPPLDLDPADGDPGPATLHLSALGRGATGAGELSRFEREHAVKPNALLLRDYDYERPRLDVTASAPTDPRPTGEYQNDDDALEKWGTWDSLSRGATTEAQGEHDNRGRLPLEQAAANAQLRVYEHHAALGPDRVDDTRAQARLEAYTRNSVRAHGEGYCRQLAPGYRFLLATDVTGVTNLDRGYVVTSVEHAGVEDGAMGDVYSNRFTCVPDDVPYRPRQKRKVRREVVESATVVGPAGHDIHTDKHGRVKVQFHWDMLGSMNERSSCWVRVLQAWSGTAYGAQFIPRIGTEVLVSFREGDHDRPVVIGSVYNGVQPFPFLPPEGQTKSGFRTRSTPGGGGYNELSFDDAAGEEQVTLHAQTDLKTHVGRDRKTTVWGSDVKRVEGKHTERVAHDVDRGVGGDEKVKIEGSRVEVVEGRSELSVGEDHLVEVGGAEHHRIERTGWLYAGDDLTTETEGNHATVVGKHDAKRSFALHVEGRTNLQSTGITEITSPSGLRLRCGTSVVEIMEDQILLLSDKIMFQAPGARMELREGGEVWLDTDEQAVITSATVTLKGQNAMLRLDAAAELLGSQISLCRPESAEGLDEVERELTTIELKDEQGRPCPNQRFILVFEDGSEQSGFVGEDGTAELYLEEGATIRFPGLLDVARGGA